ncbi:GAF domain-containing protein [Ktedonobacteria bacterium brp13]|nr:GAF domain-containing protein [Ktedonobacteria bacterium brp13]
MSEQKIQTRSLPLKVVFTRPSSGPLPDPREVAEFVESAHKTPTYTAARVQVPDLSQASEKERRSQQVKELVRLCGVLRADLSKDEVLQQIVGSMSVCTGFRNLVVNLLDKSNQFFLPAAVVGVSREDERALLGKPIPLNFIENLIQHAEFCISQSYFVPHHLDSTIFTDDIPSIVPMENTEASDIPGQWHPLDSLIVPLYSPREQKLLGFLSLDNPEDGKVPTEEAIEIVELFANKAALAIDNAHIFEEREAERIALEQGITALRNDLDLMAQGDLRQAIHSSHPKLVPVTESINATIDKINAILYEMQAMTVAVDMHMNNVHLNSETLAQDAQQQQQQINTIANTINDFAIMMHTISQRAAYLSQTAFEAMEVTNDVQSKVDRVIEGMSMVRDATLQSARLMKLLGESGQQLNETSVPLNDLTTRMHLISLNAAIEATRGGEQGQSFTVIAQEMRNLAMISAAATRKINDYIRTIQQETTQVAHSVEQSTQTVVAQSESVMQTGVSLDAMSEVTEQLSNLVQEICATADTQTQGSQQMMTAVHEVRRMTSDVTSHMEEMRTSVNNLFESANSLRKKMTQIQLR